ncbi:DNA-binding PadR family transcriptional regulator [Nocardioides daedukensis]|uniref:DNA-binding PadR family transcriptional regulator n=1 Tax=Nocardioides daedukensis TaxID=634462 RepID=A0A7Y9UU03_9ACTN|nr:PadR family transcriptional regulator [Nocardioides daedukensis]NYG59624.1 DNA-binding PadR family transcriptional regulator [Nocardioides daedukensis]
MALEHALLVSLSERTASGLELTRRFDKSIGHFWTASHQQIYRVLGRMERDGWVRSEVVAQQGRPDKKVYEVTEPGRLELERWLAEPTAVEPLRSELMVKFRGASYGDRAALIEQARAKLVEHTQRLALYESMEARDYPDPPALTGRELDIYLVLRGGVRMEQFWIDWLTDYLQAHEPAVVARRTGSS